MSKKIILSVLLVASVCIADAQFLKSILPSPEFANALEKIVLDFRLDYKNIQGDLLDKQGEVDVFESSVKLPGTTDCRILRFHSAKDTTAGWQAVMYSGEDYKEALSSYNNTCRLLKKSKMKWIDLSAVSFQGDIQAPKESVRFATTNLYLELIDDRYKDFEAQVDLLPTYAGFEVQLSLHKRVKDH